MRNRPALIGDYRSDAVVFRSGVQKAWIAVLLLGARLRVLLEGGEGGHRDQGPAVAVDDVGALGEGQGAVRITAEAADGTLYTTNLRGARATDTYICQGGKETWQPQFTFHGFQYVELTGYPKKPGLDAIRGIELTSATPVVGDFACSDEMANTLYRNICQTQRANFIDIPWVKSAAAAMTPGSLIYNLVYVGFIIFFCFFYTALVFNARETADNLKRSGAFIPGIRPGQNTAKYIDGVMSRLTLIGAIYITAVCLLPEFMIVYWNVPFYFGGTSLLIIVVVVMDFISQIQSHLMSHQYEGLMKKANLKGYGRSGI